MHNAADTPQKVDSRSLVQYAADQMETLPCTAGHVAAATAA